MLPEFAKFLPMQKKCCFSVEKPAGAKWDSHYVLPETWQAIRQSERNAAGEKIFSYLFNEYKKTGKHDAIWKLYNTLENGNSKYGLGSMTESMYEYCRQRKDYVNQRQMLIKMVSYPVPRFRQRNGNGKNPARQWFKSGDFFVPSAKKTTRPLTVWIVGSE